MGRINLIMVLLLIVFSNNIYSKDNNISIIPYPNNLISYGGEISLKNGILILGSEKISKLYYDCFEKDFGIKKNSKGLKIKLSESKNFENDEAYSLVVDFDGITINSKGYKGQFYALQTIKQLIKDKKIARLNIEDSPMFSWRSFMLDEARHFHGKVIVKQLLNEMAALKLNTFHWHLTDDAGWRIQIKKYPLLTEVGSKRDSTQIEDVNLQIPPETGDPAYDNFLKRYHSNKFDGKPHQGYYTQEDIKEIVKYANERGIQIIPEISMPGHASAAIAAYPFLGVKNQEIKVPVKFGVMYNVFDPSSEKSVQFLKDVLKEVSALFPAPYIHIGGDEVKHNQWKESENITKYMNEHNLKNYKDVQVRFTNEISDYVENYLGKSIIGWSEILGVDTHFWQMEGSKSSQNLSKNAMVQFWTGNKDILKYALDNNYKVVNSYADDTYMNYTYDQISLKRAYDFEVVPKGYEKSSIVGLGCQLWTEWIADFKTIQYHIFPRIAAYAESGWTQADKKSYDRFLKDLIPLMNQWKNKGYNLPKLDIN